MSITHAIAHLFRLNHGRVETFWRHGELFVGFRCDTCGRLQGVHMIDLRGEK